MVSVSSSSYFIFTNYAGFLFVFSDQVFDFCEYFEVRMKINTLQTFIQIVIMMNIVSCIIVHLRTETLKPLVQALDVVFTKIHNFANFTCSLVVWPALFVKYAAFCLLHSFTEASKLDVFKSDDLNKFDSEIIKMQRASHVDDFSEMETNDTFNSPVSDYANSEYGRQL